MSKLAIRLVFGFMILTAPLALVGCGEPAPATPPTTTPAATPTPAVPATPAPAPAK